MIIKQEHNVIFIICDELTGLKYLSPELISTLNGINKFSKRCVSISNHYTNSLPCSAARSIIYTGKHINVTKVTDNVQASIPWQKSLKTVEQGLKTFGTYFKSSNPRYVGKFHLAQELDPSNYVRYKPKIATENYLNPYDFELYNKMGDFCYDSRLAYFNDSLVTEEYLPTGTSIDKCDYWDKQTNNCLDGAIPYMKSKVKTFEQFVLCCNYDNPHDILYSNIVTGPGTDQSTLTSLTGQLSGSKINNFKNIQTVGKYNDNFTLYTDIDTFFKKSIELDNSMCSLTNISPIYPARLNMIVSKYIYYGIDYFNFQEFNQYQCAYYRCIKQVDGELEKLYDFMESAGLFENSIICLTSDHGDYVCEHGLIQKDSPIYNSGSNVPLFLSYPNMPSFYRGYTDNQIISSHMNLLPTLMKLYGYSDECIENLGLKPSIIGTNGLLINQDYRVVFLFLSFNFGPSLELVAKQTENLDLQKDMVESGLDQFTYISFPGFSVCSKFNVLNNNWNCGYYFSLLHVFIQTVNYWGTAEFGKQIVDFITEYKNHNTSQQWILQDATNSVPYAYIGEPARLEFQARTDPFVINNFPKPIIILYNYCESAYTKYLFEDPIYHTQILSMSLIELCENKLGTKNPTLNYGPYCITNESNNSNVIYTGTYEQLEQILKYDFIVGEIIYCPRIIPFISTNTQYITNQIIHPIFNNVFICYNIDEKRELFENYSSNVKMVDVLLRIGSSFENYDLLDYLSQFGKTQYVLTTLYDIIRFFNSDDKLRLPGVDMSVKQLIRKKFLVQLFNNTEDFEELYNLVDGSRIEKTTHVVKTETFDKLYSNIKANNLEQIFISLPVELVFENIRLD